MISNQGISYIVPVYNEEQGITSTLQRLFNTLRMLDLPWEIIVVNDGSLDKSKEKAEQFEHIKIVNHPINIGYGNALKSGIMSSSYNWIGIVDADGSYPIEDIPKLIQEMQNGFDMVIGSRKNTFKIDKSFKKFSRWIFKTIIRLAIKGNIEDANSGFRIFERDLATNLFPFLCGTFSFTTSLTILAIGKSYFIKYIPIQYNQRKGKSKVGHIRDSIRALQYIIQGITFFNPIKFFMILSVLMIFIVCIPAMFFALFRMYTLSLYYMIFGTTVTLLIAIGVLADVIRISTSRKD